jgi:hypothetical protein
MGEPKDIPNWHGLYKAALSESDANKLPTRIEEARRALIARVRELFEDSTNSVGETHCIEGALYVLHAMESTLRWKTKDRRRTARPE